MPVLLRAASARGAWLWGCVVDADTNGDGQRTLEARADGALVGDAASPWLYAGGRRLDGTPLVAGQDGRFLVVRTQDDAVALLDAQSGTVTALADARVEPDPSGNLWHRQLAFDDAGRRLAYPTEHGVRVVALDESGAATTLADVSLPGRRVVELTLHEATLALRLVPASGGSPVSRARPLPPCSHAVPRPVGWPRSKLEPERFVLRLPTVEPARAELRAVPDLLTPLGQHLLRDGGGGRLLLETAAGRLTEPWRGRCGGLPLAVQERAGTVLFGCNGSGFRKQLELRGSDGSASTLEQTVAPRLDAFVRRVSARLLAVYPGADAGVVDLEQRRYVPLLAGDHVVSVFGARVLVQRGTQLRWVDVEAAAGAPAAAPNGVALGETEPLLEPLLAGGYAYVRPWLVELTSGTATRVEEPVLAVDTSGRVLVAASGGSATVARGPLRWSAPFPAAPARAPNGKPP